VRLLLLATLLAATGAADELPRLEPRALCVTRGELAAKNVTHGNIRIEAPTVRAIAPDTDGNQAELRFVYDGPTAVAAPLGSGALRRQIGLKLRARDGCNLLYVMWRIEPKPGIVVSVKSNPGARTFAECRNGGYRNLRGTVEEPPPIAIGAPRSLKAAIAGSTLKVWADGKLAWQGELDSDTMSLAGPIGLRSDNGRFSVELRAPTHPSATVERCRAVDEE
jgi:hypothetical protein